MNVQISVKQNAVHNVRLFDKIPDSNKLANSTGTLTEISVELSPD